MRFESLDKQLRVYETTNDISVLPNIYMVARLDGKGFTRLTKEIHDFEKPFSDRFRDYMIETTKHLMCSDFNFVFGYTQSDEISLLFSLKEAVYRRKLRKLHSVLAGEASAKFSLCLGDVAVFDCRISQLPSKELVQDYFRWRNEDAFRNALSAYCYWTLRKNGMDYKKATSKLEGLSISDKNELLFENGINFNAVPNWQKRGVGFYWKEIEKEGVNPKTNEIQKSKKRILEIDVELPKGDDFSALLNKIVKE